MKRNKSLPSPQKGAAMLLMAMLILVFIALTVIGASRLTIKEKARTRNVGSSVTALQKAEESAECVLWARTQIRQNCYLYSAPDPNALKILQRDIIESYCQDHQDDVRILHQNDDGSEQPVRDCSSPWYANKILTKGEEEKEVFDTTEPRSAGAGVGVVAGSNLGTLYNPTIPQGLSNLLTCCEKVAYHGEFLNTTFNCVDFMSPQSSAPAKADRDARNDWLEDWDECAGPCVGDACAFYDSTFNIGERSGAKWCLTYWKNGGPDITKTNGTAGSMVYCMDQSVTAGKPAGKNPADYWREPDMAGFCNYDHRISSVTYNEGANGGAGTGSICDSLPTTSEYDHLWGTRYNFNDSNTRGIINPNSDPERCGSIRYARANNNNKKECCELELAGNDNPHVSAQECCQLSSAYRNDPNKKCACCDAGVAQDGGSCDKGSATWCECNGQCNHKDCPGFDCATCWPCGNDDNDIKCNLNCNLCPCDNDCPLNTRCAQCGTCSDSKCPGYCNTCDPCGTGPWCSLNCSVCTDCSLCFKCDTCDPCGTTSACSVNCTLCPSGTGCSGGGLPKDGNDDGIDGFQPVTPEMPFDGMF